MRCFARPACSTRRRPGSHRRSRARASPDRGWRRACPGPRQGQRPQRWPGDGSGGSTSSCQGGGTGSRCKLAESGGSAAASTIRQTPHSVDQHSNPDVSSSVALRRRWEKRAAHHRRSVPAGCDARLSSASRQLVRPCRSPECLFKHLGTAS